ncbi:alpha/beta-hydrolase [Hesseltinella vesiculosa]|uniref:Alpha/beta-hydrolase n=1 Tax=Hesseltinella vesiculosa TaxID=101127 RepID=A0A1X2GGT4_9FUNG|nr:alpha/beta-hydrolase [Hesseltinella vesiculosa]
MVSTSLLVNSLPPDPQPSASSRLLRPFREMKHWLHPRHRKQKKKQPTPPPPVQQVHSQEREEEPEPAPSQAIALTLTASVSASMHQEKMVILDGERHVFVPANDSSMSTNLKAFVHFDPERAFVGIGAEENMVWMPIDRYHWLLTQLQEEQAVLAFLKSNLLKPAGSFSSSQSPTPFRLGVATSFLLQPNPVITIHKNPSTASLASFSSVSTSASPPTPRRSSSRRRHSSLLSKTFHPTWFSVPKSLLVQAAAFLPKGLDQPVHSGPAAMATDLTKPAYDRLCRYADTLTLASHDLAMHPSHSTYAFTCVRCCKPIVPHLAFPDPSMLTNHSLIPSMVDDEIKPRSPPPPSLHHDSIASPSPLPTLAPFFTIAYSQPILNTSSDSTQFQLYTPTRYSYYHSSGRPLSQTPQPQHLAVPTSPPLSASSSTQPPTSPKPQDFNTFPRRHTLHYTQHGSTDQLSCADSISSSGAGGSFSLSFLPNQIERKGLLAIDHQHQEILLVFPGLPPSSSGRLDVDPTFFSSVPWQEDNDDKPTSLFHQEYQRRKRKVSRRVTLLRGRSKEDATIPEHDEPHIDASSASLSPQQTHQPPFVLFGALTAWRKCEIHVATLLMKICQGLPLHYRVVMVGHGVGAAVAALCAYSLVSTGLLRDRQVTYCGLHPPRIGDERFSQLLAHHHIETIRVMHPKDVMAHLPPRTTGLVHLGQMTILDNHQAQQPSLVFSGPHPHDLEDALDRSHPAPGSLDADVSSHALGRPLVVDCPVKG